MAVKVGATSTRVLISTEISAISIEISMASLPHGKEGLASTPAVVLNVIDISIGKGVPGTLALSIEISMVPEHFRIVTVVT